MVTGKLDVRAAAESLPEEAAEPIMDEVDEEDMEQDELADTEDTEEKDE